MLFDTQGIDSCDGKTQRLLGDSVPKCALECNETYVEPQRPRHILKFELARLGGQNAASTWGLASADVYSRR